MSSTGDTATDTERLSLTDFLLARIAEDEAVAQEALGALNGWDCWAAVANDAIAQRKYEVGAHILYQHLDDVIADCQARREIVGLFHDTEHADIHCDAWTVMKSVMRGMARRYASHPDFRDEWRP